MAINTNILKTYAPEARRAFIAAVKARAARFGITETGSSPIREEGNVAIINGQPYPRSFAKQRRNLDHKIGVRGYDAVMEEVAYTWFNRLAAIRYMELHDYLDHGIRVLNHPNGGSTPEIVEKATSVDLPGLKREQVVALKLDGTKEEELYRMLIVAQCNALHAAMPFLFERINDETELLLPDNLLHSESLIRQLVERIPEADWQHIEIIGWLYQFYISEKKDQVIGKVVKAEDIPAATQLFTPNWIVKYMVQNSLGAKWLATHPESSIRAKMEYYVEPAEQPDEVQSQIEITTPNVLDPEKLTFLDPASGSGHILVEAYNLFREIYLERGYRLRDIPRLILEKNLYGLDIDDRAAQLSGFALLMRARSDDRQILSPQAPASLNILALQDANNIDVDSIVQSMVDVPEQIEGVRSSWERVEGAITQSDVSAGADRERKTIDFLVTAFAQAKERGSLITVPEVLIDDILHLKKVVDENLANPLLDTWEHEYAANVLSPLVRQAALLCKRYDVVSANPPYMGSKGMNGFLKAWAERNFTDSRSDLFAMFIERCMSFCSPGGRVAMVTMESWMFLSTYERLRSKILSHGTLNSMVHMPYLGKGGTSMGINFGTVAFTLDTSPRPAYRGSYSCVRYFETDALGVPFEFPVQNERRSEASSEDFWKIPGAPIVYWASGNVLSLFDRRNSLRDALNTREGLTTGSNDRFLRLWHEVSISKIGFDVGSTQESIKSGKRWFPYIKGGEFRRWSGNFEYVVNWFNDGEELRRFSDPTTGRIRSHNYNGDFGFRPGVTWPGMTSGKFSSRFVPEGFMFDAKGPMGFQSQAVSPEYIVAFLNSVVAKYLLGMLAPTMDFKLGHILNLPLVATSEERSTKLATGAIIAAKADWDAYETSWNFASSPLLAEIGDHSIRHSWLKLRESHRDQTNKMSLVDVQNDRDFIESYGLGDVLEPIARPEEITLHCNPAYRYGSDKSEEEAETLLLADTVRDFLSYAVGCMFGRYSLDAPGIVLASQSQTLQEYLARVPSSRFMADLDNVIPVMDDVWFTDDATDRFFEFLRVTFGDEGFAENLEFIEAALGKDVRKYFKRDFYADHLRRYKKRPIYWLFSSGKEKAFEALVYLHRYNEGTLARMRLEYVVPLQTQMSGRVQRLTDELGTGNLSSSETKKRNVELSKLQKQQEELRRFEEELHHFADQRITLDLDDGVKVNYGKFGNLLADVKTIAGEKDD